MQDKVATQYQIDYGEVVGRSFVDKLLLAIIDAHTGSISATASAVKQRSERLRDAKEALFGQPHPEGRPKNDDAAILRWIGEKHRADLCRRDMARYNNKKPPKPRSIRELIRDAIDRFDLPGSSEERIRKKFTAQKRKWLDIAAIHDDVPEQLDHNLLLEICTILERRGIAMELSRIEH